MDNYYGIRLMLSIIFALDISNEKTVKQIANQITKEKLSKPDQKNLQQRIRANLRKLESMSVIGKDVNITELNIHEYKYKLNVQWFNIINAGKLRDKSETNIIEV